MAPAIAVDLVGWRWFASLGVGEKPLVFATRRSVRRGPPVLPRARREARRQNFFGIVGGAKKDDASPGEPASSERGMEVTCAG